MWKWSGNCCNLTSLSLVNREAEDDPGQLLLDNRVHPHRILRSPRPEDISVPGVLYYLCGHHGGKPWAGGLDLHGASSPHTHVHLSGQPGSDGLLLLLCHHSQDARELLFCGQKDFSL